MPPLLRTSTAALLLLVTTAATPVAAAAPPTLDLPAALRALERTTVHAAPGAIATFDQEQVEAALPPDARVLLLPPTELGAGSSYDTVYAPLSDWADERELSVALVTGLEVQLVGLGTVTQSHLVDVREILAQRDVTESLVFAGEVLARDGEQPPDDTPTVDAAVAADPALVAQVVAGLGAGRTWVAAGVDADLPDAAELAELVPGLALRVVALPQVPRDQPYPDLPAALVAAFPGELVVVVRGPWIEAAGPGQSEVDSARNYVLGAYRKQLARDVTTPQAVVRLFLERLGQLRYGEAFRRPPVDPTSSQELLSRLAPATGLLAAVGLGGGSLGHWLRGRVRRRRAVTLAYLRERVEVYARLQRVGAVLVADGARSAAGDVAERHAVAGALFDQAEAHQDPAVLAAAVEALAEAERLLARVAS